MMGEVAYNKRIKDANGAEIFMDTGDYVKKSYVSSRVWIGLLLFASIVFGYFGIMSIVYAISKGWFSFLIIGIPCIVATIYSC